jgi:FkbM family methyltransferase
MSVVRRALGRVRRAAVAGARELAGSPAVAPAPATPPPPAPALAPPVRMAVGLSDGRVLAEHPVAPHMIVDGYCLLVTPRVLMGTYEPVVSAFLHRAVGAGDTVLDIGANQGFHTLTLGLGVGPQGTVWAFEPHPRTRRILADNVASIGLHHAVKIVDAAAWSSDGTLTFRAPVGEAAGWFGRAAFSVRDETDECADLEVRSVDVAAFLAGLPTPPSLIKLDAEGSETTILRAAESALRATHPTVVMEVLPAAFESPAALDDWEVWLRGLGYEIGRLDEHANVQPLGADGFRTITHSADVVLWVPGGRGAPR